MILPTVLDTGAYDTARVPSPGSPVTIGWIGSPTNWPYVRPILPILQELVETRGVRVRVIGAGSAARQDTFPGLEHVDWSEASEVEEIRSLDIGVMPAPDDGWVRGKCGYKLVQYMACGLPVVASPVGTNEELVTPGHNGFLAGSNDAWRAALLRLIDDAPLRRAFGAAGLQRVKERYSLQVQAPRLVQLLQSIA
jgi:glycosyltransferase involved in cell wall biosynthesis